MKVHRRPIATLALLSVAAGLLLAGPACSRPTPPTYPGGARKEKMPEGLKGVEIAPNLGAKLPLERPFVDDRGKTIKLGDYFDRDRPVILSLGYYRCPMLCDLVLNGVIDALKQTDWEPGREFEIVTVSIDPRETPELARLKKQNYVKAYGKSSARRGWHFLTGQEKDISALATTIGFFYRYDAETNEFAHAAGVFLVSPSGEVTRCLRGVEFDPQTVRLSLVEASEGKQGSTVDRALLWCFHYDPEKGTYKFGATIVMKVAGGLILIVLAAILLPAWLRRRLTAPVAEKA